MSDSFIPLCVPEIRGNEWTYVKECLDTGWVSSVGSYVDRFEQMVAERVDARFGIACVNGTSALHVSLMLAGVQAGDEVLVSTLTFIAPANAIRYLGAHPVFVDAEPDYWQMDVTKAGEFLERECARENGRLVNRRTGRRVAAILPVHALGHPVDMEPLIALARRHELPVIEDATESLGATYRGTAAGHLGDIACFSFNGNKILTTGGGGVIVTDRETWATRARYLTTQAKDDPVEYVHHEIGYNYRLTNLQAAMGCGQMERLDDCIASKRDTARFYAGAFADLPGITCMREASWAGSIAWMFTIRLDADLFGCGSRDLLRVLGGQKIQTRPLWQPIHRSPAHAGAQALGGEVADALYRDCLSLPCSAGITAAERERVAAAVRAAHKSPSVAR